MSQSVGGGPQGPLIAPCRKLLTHPLFFSLLQIGSDLEQNLPPLCCNLSKSQNRKLFIGSDLTQVEGPCGTWSLKVGFWEETCRGHLLHARIPHQSCIYHSGIGRPAPCCGFYSCVVFACQHGNILSSFKSNQTMTI